MQHASGGGGLPTIHWGSGDVDDPCFHLTCCHLGGRFDETWPASICYTDNLEPAPACCCAKQPRVLAGCAQFRSTSKQGLQAAKPIGLSPPAREQVL